MGDRALKPGHRLSPLEPVAPQWSPGDGRQGGAGTTEGTVSPE